MALSPILGAFTWGAGGSKLTPEEIATQRAMLARRRLQGVDTSPIASPWQGAARIADAFGDVMQERRLGQAATENAAVNQDIIASLLGGAAPSQPTARVAQELSATSPSIPVSGGPEAYRNAIASIESAGSGDYAAIGPTNPKLGRALGRYQIMEANITPWAQEALGRPVSTDEFLASPQIQDAIFDKKFGSYVSQYGPEGAAQAWFAGPGGVGKTSRKDVLGTSVGEYGNKFRNALGAVEVSASSPQSAIETVAPASGYVDPSVSAPNSSVASALAPSLPPSRNISSAPAVAAMPQVDQAQNIAPTNSLGVNPAVIQALTSPYANEQTKGIAQLLMQRQQGEADQQRKLALADQQRQQEIARRQSIAQQSGIDPAFAQDDELWKAAAGNVFAAPSTSTVGANVIDNRTGKPIYQGTPEAPTSVQEFEYAKKQGYEGNYAQYQSDMKRASANNTTINNGEGNKFFNVLDENNAKTFSALSDTGMQARSNIAQVEQLGKLLETTPTGATAALKQAAGEYGINTEGLSDIQAATALINKLVPAQRQPGSGSMSDQDLALFKQSLPRLINQPGSNATIVNTLKAISQYQIQQGAIADRVANREMTPAEARKAIADLPNPLAGFKPPAAGKEDEGWQERPDLGGNVKIRKLNK